MRKKYSDYIGQRFGRLVVLGFGKARENGKQTFLVKCDCGNLKEILCDNIYKTKSCGCLSREKSSERLKTQHKEKEFPGTFKMQDLTGKRFGRLVVFGLAYKKPPTIYWNCICDCGESRVVAAGNLRRGLTRSCGCLSREKASERGKVLLTRHGHSSESLYRVWSSMRMRVSENDPTGRYFSRGIRCCEEWKDFETFYQWAIGSGYRKGLSIDRIDNNGNYEPANCRWATNTQQQQNTRRTRMILFEGKTFCASEWSRRLGIPISTICKRDRNGKPIAGRQPDGSYK